MGYFKQITANSHNNADQISPEKIKSLSLKNKIDDLKNILSVPTRNELPETIPASALKLNDIGFTTLDNDTDKIFHRESAEGMTAETRISWMINQLLPNYYRNRVWSQLMPYTGESVSENHRKFKETDPEYILPVISIETDFSNVRTLIIDTPNRIPFLRIDLQDAVKTSIGSADDNKIKITITYTPNFSEFTNAMFSMIAPNNNTGKKLKLSTLLEKINAEHKFKSAADLLNNASDSIILNAGNITPKQIYIIESFMDIKEYETLDPERFIDFIRELEDENYNTNTMECARPIFEDIIKSYDGTVQKVATQIKHGIQECTGIPTEIKIEFKTYKFNHGESDYIDPIII